MNTQIFNHLNSEQKKAVEYLNQSSIILAGAGSGKTRVLVAKVISLINFGVNPKNILMITFTNKAASEMKNRIGPSHKIGFVGTFHSLCAMILRIHSHLIGITNQFIIYDENDQINLLKNILKEGHLDKKYTAYFFLNRISSAKNQMISPSHYQKSFSDHNSQMTALVYEQYQKKLRANRAVDFDDLLMLVVELFNTHKDILDKYQNRFKYILVDEFQDTNYTQYLLTQLLADKYKNITVVGDFSQSIYSWRGAEIHNLVNFQKHFPNTVTFYLKKNYRSSKTILSYAYQIIAKNQTHPILELYTDNHQGEDVVFYEANNEQEEAIFIVMTIERLKERYDYDEIAILYRTNAQSRAIEEAFLHSSLPYVLIGGTRFYDRKEIKDVISYLRLLVNPIDQLSRDRIQKLGKRRWQKFQEYYKQYNQQIKKTTDEIIEELFKATDYLSLFDEEQEEDYSRLENIKELKSVALSFPDINQFLEQIALVESEYSADEKTSQLKNGVKLMTLHQAKGLEFKVVIIVGLEEGILPHSKSQDSLHEIEEERRLFYVGITRAKELLYITYARQRFIFGQRSYSIKSRFLDE